MHPRQYHCLGICKTEKTRRSHSSSRLTFFRAIYLLVTWQNAEIFVLPTKRVYGCAKDTPIYTTVVNDRASPDVLSSVPTFIIIQAISAFDVRERRLVCFPTERSSFTRCGTKCLSSLVSSFDQFPVRRTTSFRFDLIVLKTEARSLTNLGRSSFVG